MAGHSRKFIDLVGQKFGRLTVLEMLPERTKSGAIRWLCQCDCPERTQTIVAGGNLRSGAVRSCECLRLEAVITHGMSRTPLHNVWITMNQRCTNPNHPHFKDYGGRGIKVCEEWCQSFLVYFNYVMENLGDRPSKKHSIDRIDNDGNYEPGNLRWATQTQQIHNQRSRRRYKASVIIEAMNGICPLAA
jgi:hypothetical protein